MANLKKISNFEQNSFFMEIYHPSMNDVLAEQISKAMDQKINIHELVPIAGGSINTAVLIKTNHGKYFAKYNQHQTTNGIFKAETANLNLIRNSRTLNVPGVITTFNFEDVDFLVLEYIESGSPHYEFWRDLGYGLAHLHKNQAENFGLNYDNYIGILPQVNTESSSWSDFFINNRLDPMLKLAVDKGKADVFLIEKFESLYKKIPEIFPVEKPSLLHGDLWSGNVMGNEDGDPVVYDPATYYGHREMDIAMSKLFGGFDPEFYDAYNEIYPMHNNWEHRMQVYNLYPLLVHVNLFVGSYIQSIKNIVNRY